MENEELPFRATKDVDIVLIVESITAEFGRQFWEYVKEAGYEHLNKSTGNAQFYRFTSPKSKDYPYMIEIFSRNPDFIILEDDAILTLLPIDDEISSLSAILLNEAYYELLKTGQMMVDGIPVLSSTCLIPFKAKAWLDLKERKLNGDQVGSKNIKKHKNDVFRLAQLITANTRQIHMYTSLQRCAGLMITGSGCQNKRRSILLMKVVTEFLSLIKKLVNRKSVMDVDNGKEKHSLILHGIQRNSYLPGEKGGPIFVMTL